MYLWAECKAFTNIKIKNPGKYYILKLKICYHNICTLILFWTWLTCPTFLDWSATHRTSVTIELCNDGRISSTLWIRLRRVTPTACRSQSWPREGDVIWKIMESRKKKKDAYFDAGGILRGWHCVDVILHLHHLLYDGHDPSIHLVTRAVQLSCGLQTLSQSITFSFLSFLTMVVTSEVSFWFTLVTTVGIGGFSGGPVRVEMVHNACLPTYKRQLTMCGWKKSIYRFLSGF